MEAFFGPKRHFNPWHNYASRLVFNGRVFDVILVLTQLDVQNMLTEGKKSRMIAWDTESLDVGGKMQTLQFCMGKDKLYFVPMSLDNYIRNSFQLWFPPLMSQNNMKVTFANTENRWLLELYKWLQGDWLQISRHIDIQEVLFLRTNMVFSLKNAHNLFFPRSDWKDTRVQKKLSVDVTYSVIDAAATYNVANHVLISSELVSEIDLTLGREQIIEKIEEKPLLDERFINDDTFDVDQLSKNQQKNEEDGKLEEEQEDEIVPEIKLISPNFDFNLIDKPDMEYLSGLGLEMKGSVSEMRKYFESQNDMVQEVISDIIKERLKNRVQNQPKPLVVQQIQKPVVVQQLVRPVNDLIGVLPNKKPIQQNDLSFLIKKEVQEMSYERFKQLVRGDSSYVNRINAGGLTLLLEELKVDYKIMETSSGLDHEKIHQVTLELFNMRFTSVNKQVKDARNAAKKQFVALLFDRQSM